MKDCDCSKLMIYVREICILTIMALVSITIPKKVIRVQGVNTLTALTRALTHWQSERIRGTSNQKVAYVMNKKLYIIIIQKALLL